MNELLDTLMFIVISFALICMIFIITLSFYYDMKESKAEYERIQKVLGEIEDELVNKDD